MSLYHNRMTVSRYRLLGGLNLGQEELSKAMAPYKARAPKLQGSVQEEELCWVPPPLEGEESRMAWESEPASWGLAQCRLREGYLLRMRILRRKVPSLLLQQMLKEKLLQRIQEGKKVGRQEHQALARDLKQLLLKKSLPQLSHIDAFWQDGGDIFLFSASPQGINSFQSLFRKSFCKALKASLLPLKAPFLGKQLETLTGPKEKEASDFKELFEALLPS